MKNYNKEKLAKFDYFLIGSPNENEKILKKLLTSAKSLENKSIYLDMLARLALIQTIQKKFKLAHKTLDTAEKEITSEHILIKIRLFIERGRLFYLSNDNKAALYFLKKAYRLGKKYKDENLTIDAVHIIPAVVKSLKEKIKWNQKAIDIAKHSRNKKIANDWLPLLYQAIGLNYIEIKKYKKALESFQQAKKLAVKYSPELVILGADIGIAKSLRLLNFTDKALCMQIELLKNWKKLLKNTNHPIEMRIFHGWICEELTEIYLSKVRHFSVLAYKDLSQDDWHQKLATKRLDRLKRCFELS